MSKLSENIRNFRMLRGLTQLKLGVLLGKAPNTVANWEKGVSSPDVDTVEEMCNVLEITPNQLYGWDESKELNTFLATQKENMKEMDKLLSQKAEIEERIKEYARRLSKVNT